MSPLTTLNAQQPEDQGQGPGAPAQQSQPLMFLRTMFNHSHLSGLYIAMWSKQTQQTQFFQIPTEFDDAARHAISESQQERDVYVMACPLFERPASGSGSAKDTAALVTLWLDADVCYPGSKKEHDFYDDKTALSFLNHDLPKPPTLIVSSGHGFHPLWPFQTPIVFGGPKDGHEPDEVERDRGEAADLSRRWHEYANVMAVTCKARIDQAKDLARMIRIPGTTNWKVAGSPVPVRLIPGSGVRVRMGDLRHALEEGISKHSSLCPGLKEGNERAALRSDLTDEEQALVQKAKEAKNGVAFSALWEGTWKGAHNSQNEADLALCGKLAFWLGDDPDRIDRVFRHSGLMRDKWERPDYSQKTIDAALEGRTKFYTGETGDGATSTMPAGYRVQDGWLVTGEEEKEVRISRPVEAVAATSDAEGSAWSLRLRWKDPDGKVHNYDMPREELLSPASAVCAPLARRGLVVSDPKLLAEYLRSIESPARLYLTKRPGWGGSVYVLADGRVHGPAGDGPRVELDSAAATKAMSRTGTLDSWWAGVGELCRGNSRLLFSASCAFAGYLLHLLGEEGGGFNLRGQSSVGKSTCLRVAASVTGLGVETWKTTANGLEAVAQRHNDALLVLDEIGLMDARDAGDAVYMLAGGRGKARMSKDVTARESATWRVLVLSSGEVGLDAHMRTAGKASRAGMDARLADVPAVVEGAHGAFENLHGHADGGAFARALDAAARQNSGEAGPAFVLAVAQDRERACAETRRLRDTFLGEHTPAQAEGQVSRVAGHFAVVAAAGELAAQLGVAPWAAGEASAAVAACLRAWVDARGFAGAGEDAKVLAQVRLFLQQHGEARFATVGLDGDLADKRRWASGSRAGFKYLGPDGAVTKYVVLSEVWHAEVCRGLDYRDAARALAKLGFLKVGKKDGRAPTPERLPGFKGVQRAYVIDAAVLGGGEGG